MTTRKRTSIVIAVLASILVVLELTGKVTITWQIIVILIVGLFPWLHLFVDKIFIGENQGMTLTKDGPPARAVPTPPSADPTPFDQLPPESQKLLATLWRYQRRDVGIKGDRYWMFLIGQGQPGYGEFMRSTVTPAAQGLVTFQEGNGMAMLTPKGLEYCKQHELALNKHPERFGDWG